MKPPAPVNLRTVAEHAGVSATTVSRVLNNNPIPSEQTRQRVMAAVQQLNYKPDRLLSEAMRRQRTNTRIEPEKTHCVGFLTSHRVYDALQHQSAYYGAVTTGIHDMLLQADHHMIFSLTDGDTATQIPPVVAQGRVDGLLVQCLMPRQLRQMLVGQLPVVFVDRLYRDVEADCVLADLSGAMQEQLEYLWALGHRRIAFFDQANPVPYQMSRQEGFAAFFQDRPLPDLNPRLYQPHEIDPTTHEQVLQTYAEMLCHARPRPTALIGANGYVIRIMRHLQALGLRVPDDISIIGINDQLSGELADPAVSSYEVPMYEMGRIGAQLLLERFERPDAPVRRVHLKGRRIVRASCRAIVCDS